MAFVEEEAELPQLSPQQQHAMAMAMQRSAASMPDDDEYADFLKRVEDVGATIKGLKDGTVDVSQLDDPVAMMRGALEMAAAVKAGAPF